MMLWLTKLRISIAMDASQQAPARLRRKISSSTELRRFEQELAELDRALKQAPPKPEAPALLHRSIMLAVRAGNRPVAVAREPGLMHWAPLPVLVAIVLLGIWWVLQRPLQPTTQDTQSLVHATAALEMGNQMSRTVPSAVIAPLSNELERLGQDLDNTTRFLLASLP
jgi:hypothetical protein